MTKSAILSLKHLNDGKFGQIPEKENDAIMHLSDPMIQSFNYAVGDGLQAALHNIPPVELTTPNNAQISVGLTSISLEKPQVSQDAGGVLELRVFPRQCMESGITYKSLMTAHISCCINGRRLPYIDQNLGYIPIMVKSTLCNLHKMNPKELVSHGEDINDPGGYFIVNGTKRVLRLLTAQRRNYAIALIRDSWRQKQKHFSDKGIIVQCIARDETTSNNILHYLTTGFARLEFFINRRPFIIDFVMMLKAFKNVNDREIVSIFASMRGNDTFCIEKVKEMLTELSAMKLFTSTQCQEYIGRSFRKLLQDIVPSWYSDVQVCQLMLDRYVLIHLPDGDAKFDFLCVMACKLYGLVAGDTVPESLDVTSMMEAHLSGHLYLKYLKEKLHDMLVSLKWQIFVMLRGEKIEYQLTEGDIRKVCSRARKIGPDMESLLTTGTLSSKSGIGLQQQSGLSVVMEGLNRMRDMSHLRAIHRGSFFVEMKTVEPRRLTGEAWGFICPVHTPDGAPCGLLNHLAYNCTIPAHPHISATPLSSTLIQLGMKPMSVAAVLAGAQLHQMCSVLLDGRLVGHVNPSDATSIVFKLRVMKTKDEIYKYTEVVLIEPRPSGGQFPGLYLFTTPARMMRPVINLHTKTIEYVGTFEQMYLNIAISTEQIQKNVHTHMDVDKTQMFSNIGQLVPFSDCNPNPRNMYQCQMGKQTVGTPLHNWQVQTQNKAYRLLYPQAPLVRNAHYDKISMDDHCMGFNAVLAIVSYTGYDIEDAMTINKSSMERGLAHAQLYKTEYVDLKRIKKRGRQTSDISHIFSRDPFDSHLVEFLDEMGLPIPGTILAGGDPYYCCLDLRSQTHRTFLYKGEKCVVDKVSLVDTGSKDREAQTVCITIRAQRNPSVGDKFASRSGQKGIMSRLYPTEDLPFSERGIMPDIIFNPHGIPSRMTAGKLLELLAGKAAAEYALSFDSTPFEFSDERPAAEYFGSILEKAGFNFYGEDTMYSGIDGRMLEVNVYQGIMYYQRLKHMTEDKYQVRSTGPVDPITHQPVKGRKRGGAIRFGEMERDALIAHGAVFTLRDRLLDCSDDTRGWVCSKCGCMLSAKPVAKPGSQSSYKVPVCSVCGAGAKMFHVRMPHAFKYLVAELASLNINTKLSITDTMQVS